MRGNLDRRLAIGALVAIGGFVLLVAMLLGGSDAGPRAGEAHPSSAAASPAPPASTSPSRGGPADGPAATSSPAPTASAVDTTQRFEEAGFQITLPTGWTIRQETPSVVSARGQTTTLGIRVGGSDGGIRTCDDPGRSWERCRDVVVTSLEEFADAVEMAPIPGCSGLCAPTAAGRPTTLGGEEAWLVVISGYEHPARGGENALYVLALHEGRPFFLRFHTSANQAPGTPSGSVWKAMVDSFAFIPPLDDEDAASGVDSYLRHITIPEAALGLEVPEDWQVSIQPQRDRAVISGTDKWVTVQYTDAAGMLTVCRGMACEAFPVDSLNDLVSVVRQDYERTHGGVSAAVEEAAVPIPNGEAARVTISSAAIGASSTRYYLLAWRPSQAVVVTGQGGETLLAAYPDTQLSDILSSIRFVD